MRFLLQFGRNFGRTYQMNFHRKQRKPSRLGSFSRELCRSLLAFALTCAFGFATRVQAAPLLDPFPEPSTTWFGHTIASLGDITGDGLPDLLVAAPYQDGDIVSQATGFGLPQNVGKLFVIDGSTLAVINVMDDPEFEVIQTQHFGGQLGAALDISADINGDGVPDVIAGDARHTANPNSHDTIAFNVGKALVFSGADGSVLFTLVEGVQEEDNRFGEAVAALGDVDVDGTADFVVGAPGKARENAAGPNEDEGLPGVGIAYVYSGKTGALIRTLEDPNRDGEEEGAAFGSALANAGDVNGDGVTDVVVGAPGEGRVHVFSGQTGALLYTIVSPTNDPIPSFGQAVAGGQDLSKDQKPDIVVGAPLASKSRGAAYIFDGTNGTMIRKLNSPSPETFAGFGASVYVSADITGDRRADVIVGAPNQNVNGLLGAGQAFVYNGVRGRLFSTLTSANPQSHAGFGKGLTTVVFPGSKLATPVVGAPYQTAVVDAVTHLQIGQVEIMQ